MAISSPHGRRDACGGVNVMGVLSDLFVNFRHWSLLCDPAHRAR
jgi:hypothetical protein